MSLRMQVRAAEYHRSSSLKMRKQESKRQKTQQLLRHKPAKLLTEIAKGKLKVSHLEAASGYQALAIYVSGSWQYNEVSRRDFIAFVSQIIEIYGHRFLQTENQLNAHRRLLAWRKYWLRGVESVKISQKEGNTANDHFRHYLRSLVMGLLAKYPVPHFMLNAWLNDNSQHQAWFVRLAQGESLYGAAGIPTTITRKVLHQFVNLSQSFGDIDRALVFAQASQIGCSTSQVQEIVQNTQANYLKDNAFWVQVFRFIGQKAYGLALREINPLIDYLNHCHKHIKKFNLKGRSLSNLLVGMHEWHENNMLRNQVENFSQGSNQKFSKWKGLNIDNYITWYQFEDKPELDGRYRIVQLNNSRLLELESASQRHCVASYVQSCINGYSSIWSFAKQDLTTKAWERLLTIEVQPNRRQIVQIRGKRNARPDAWQMEIIRDWAMQSRLRLGGYH